MSQVWFITGCSSGFGGEIAKQALARGDKVIATARNPTKITNLKELGAETLALDITAGDAVVQAVVADAYKIYGKIDILLNNAAYILEGAIEECSDAEVKAQFETNIFGQLTVLRAVLPYMRKQKSGTIAQMGSVGGWHGGAGHGMYCSTKLALYGITNSLEEEVAHLGIKVTLIEPGYFRTNFLSGGHRISAEKRIDDLEPVMGPQRSTLDAVDNNQPGNPVKGSKLIVEVLTGTGRCAGRKLPSRFVFGSDAVATVDGILEKHKKELDEWRDITVTTDCDDVVAK